MDQRRKIIIISVSVVLGLIILSVGISGLRTLTMRRRLVQERSEITVPEQLIDADGNVLTWSITAEECAVLAEYPELRDSDYYRNNC